MTVQVGALRNLLQTKRSELLRLIRAHSSQLCHEEGRLLDVLNRTVAQVDAALIAVEVGAYGICVECGEPISSRRLETLPWALHCVRCQKVFDRRSRTRVAASRWGKAA
jgi:RNA polymerase-binding transcription factor DksA